MFEQPPKQAGFCGCDSIDCAASLISVDDALGIIAETARPHQQRHEVDLPDAVSRVLAQDVTALAPVPPFDNSAVDGYALCLPDVPPGLPMTLNVTDRVVAGRAQGPALDRNSAIQVMTGAPLPPGTTTVVMQEHVARAGDTITLRRLPRPGENMRRRGEDMAEDAVMLRAGTRLTPGSIAVAAAAGAQKLAVRPRLRVGLLVTGCEVTLGGASLEAGHIRDANSPTLLAAMRRLGLDVTVHRHVEDTAAATRAALRELSATVDLLVTTGGLSVGEEDHVKPGFAELGGDLLFSGVAVKPGKPVSYGRLGRCAWLGLPGNPQAAYLMWDLFGTFLCHRLQGARPPRSTSRCVVLGEDLTHKPGRCELRLARITGMDGLGRETVRFGASTQSGQVHALAEADGVIVIPAETDHLPAGSLVDLHPFACC